MSVFWCEEEEGEVRPLGKSLKHLPGSGPITSAQGYCLDLVIPAGRGLRQTEETESAISADPSWNKEGSSVKRKMDEGTV